MESIASPLLGDLISEHGNIIDLRGDKLDETTHSDHEYAFVITMFGGDGYVPAAINVGNSLKTLCTTINNKVVVMITEDVPDAAKKLLAIFFDYVYIIDYIICDDAVNGKIITLKPHYSKVWTKLNALRLVSFKKICLIDADYLNIMDISEIFNKNVPCACSEMPTGLNLEITEFFSPYDKRGTFEYSNLLGIDKVSCPVVLFLIYLYSNNIEANIRKNYGNFYFGGLNASIMLLKPDLDEFKYILRDLKKYNFKKLKFFYPEQQYLTLRYSLPCLKEDPVKIISDLIKYLKEKNIIKPFYNKLVFFKDIISQEQISRCISLNYENICNYDNTTNDEKILYTDIINIVSYILNYYYHVYKEDLDYVKDKPVWTLLEYEYYNTEYYKKYTPGKPIRGFPLLQQIKFWTPDGLFVKTPTKRSNGVHHWYYLFTKAIKKISENLSLSPYLNKYKQIYNTYYYTFLHNIDQSNTDLLLKRLNNPTISHNAFMDYLKTTPSYNPISDILYKYPDDSIFELQKITKLYQTLENIELNIKKHPSFNWSFNNAFQLGGANEQKYYNKYLKYKHKYLTIKSKYFLN
jgi:hypothetical protein